MPADQWVCAGGPEFELLGSETSEQPRLRRWVAAADCKAAEILGSGCRSVGSEAGDSLRYTLAASEPTDYCMRRGIEPKARIKSSCMSL